MALERRRLYTFPYEICTVPRCSWIFLWGTSKNSEDYALFPDVPFDCGMTFERRISYTFLYVFIYLSCHSQIQIYVPDASHSFAHGPLRSSLICSALCHDHSFPSVFAGEFPLSLSASDCSRLRSPVYCLGLLVDRLPLSRSTVPEPGGNLQGSFHLLRSMQRLSVLFLRFLAAVVASFFTRGLRYVGALRLSPLLFRKLVQQSVYSSERYAVIWKLLCFSLRGLRCIVVARTLATTGGHELRYHSRSVLGYDVSTYVARPSLLIAADLWLIGRFFASRAPLDFHCRLDEIQVRDVRHVALRACLRWVQYPRPHVD